MLYSPKAFRELREGNHALLFSISLSRLLLVTLIQRFLCLTLFLITHVTTRGRAKTGPVLSLCITILFHSIGFLYLLSAALAVLIYPLEVFFAYIAGLSMNLSMPENSYRRFADRAIHNQLVFAEERNQLVFAVSVDKADPDYWGSPQVIRGCLWTIVKGAGPRSRETIEDVIRFLEIGQTFSGLLLQENDLYVEILMPWNFGRGYLWSIDRFFRSTQTNQVQFGSESEVISGSHFPWKYSSMQYCLRLVEGVPPIHSEFEVIATGCRRKRITMNHVMATAVLKEKFRSRGNRALAMDFAHAEKPIVRRSNVALVKYVVGVVIVVVYVSVFGLDRVFDRENIRHQAYLLAIWTLWVNLGYIPFLKRESIPPEDMIKYHRSAVIAGCSMENRQVWVDDNHVSWSAAEKLGGIKLEPITVVEAAALAHVFVGTNTAVRLHSRGDRSEQSSVVWHNNEAECVGWRQGGLGVYSAAPLDAKVR